MAEVKILYEDKDIIVVVKPAGMASQEERSADMDMVSWLKNYFVREKKVKGMPYIGVIHRLDKPVGGVMVYAKTQQAALTGTLPKKEGRLEDMLISNGKTNRTEVVADKTSGAKKAALEYKVKRTKFDQGQQYSLVNVHLITGRRHQIRVQMAHAGAGLWGDTRYNPVFADKKGWFDLALFAWHLEFDHPMTKKHLIFKEQAGPQITAHFKAEECK